MVSGGAAMRNPHAIPIDARMTLGRKLLRIAFQPLISGKSVPQTRALRRPFFLVAANRLNLFRGLNSDLGLTLNLFRDSFSHDGESDGISRCNSIVRRIFATERPPRHRRRLPRHQEAHAYRGTWNSRGTGNVSTMPGTWAAGMQRLVSH